MTITNIAQSSSPFQLQQHDSVYEYAFTVINTKDSDTQKLTAAFVNLATPQDWKRWLSGWTDCGYSLQSTPQLIRII